MSNEQTIKEILLRYWGHSSFRPLQQEIILSVLNGTDTLALMPTGGGKSICFQVPALAKEGICIVISPLISLMKDQVENLRKRGIKAMAVISGMSRKEIDIALDNCVYGDIKFLYLSPERLTSELTRIRLQKMKVNLIAVDEAHCVSQWGYDFRPSYLRIAEVRELHPNVPILALTATATSNVRTDIMQQLHFKGNTVFQKSFERKNISYLVYHDSDKVQRMVEILSKVNACSIVYVRSRRKTKEIAQTLLASGISAAFYHAGLTQQQRNKVQDDWKKNKTKVIVATNAFGMGIDKPDVRTVIHFDTPESLEAYYQEAGRAGRDEKNAYAILLHSRADRAEIERSFELSFPEIRFIKTVYNALGNFFNMAVGGGAGISRDFDLSAFIKTYNLNPISTAHALKIIEEAGYISISDGVFMPSRLKFTVNQLNLYNFQVMHNTIDKFIKTILRTYGGLFDNFVKINEGDLATKTGLTIEQVVKGFNFLQKHSICEYLPHTDKPQLTFLLERYRADDIEINERMLAFRKERFRQRAEKMLLYAESKTNCRNMMLLNYFGENSNARCGTCDFCRNRNKLEINDVEFGLLKQKIKSLLHGKQVTLNEVISSVKDTSNDQSVRALRWLVDSGTISINEQEFLKWNEQA